MERHRQMFCRARRDHERCKVCHLSCYFLSFGFTLFGVLVGVLLGVYPFFKGHLVEAFFTVVVFLLPRVRVRTRVPGNSSAFRLYSSCRSCAFRSKSGTSVNLIQDFLSYTLQCLETPRVPIIPKLVIPSITILFFVGVQYFAENIWINLAIPPLVLCFVVGAQTRRSTSSTRSTRAGGWRPCTSSTRLSRTS